MVTLRNRLGGRRSSPRQIAGLLGCQAAARCRGAGPRWRLTSHPLVAPHGMGAQARAGSLGRRSLRRMPHLREDPAVDVHVHEGVVERRDELQIAVAALRGSRLGGLRRGLVLGAGALGERRGLGRVGGSGVREGRQRDAGPAEEEEALMLLGERGRGVDRDVAAAADEGAVVLAEDEGARDLADVARREGPRREWKPVVPRGALAVLAAESEGSGAQLSDRDSGWIAEARRARGAAGEGPFAHLVSQSAQ